MLLNNDIFHDHCPIGNRDGTFDRAVTSRGVSSCSYFVDFQLYSTAFEETGQAKLSSGQKVIWYGLMNKGSIQVQLVRDRPDRQAAVAQMAELLTVNIR
jgi:hypothetical protein